MCLHKYAYKYTESRQWECSGNTGRLHILFWKHLNLILNFVSKSKSIWTLYTTMYSHSFSLRNRPSGANPNWLCRSPGHTTHQLHTGGRTVACVPSQSFVPTDWRPPPKCIWHSALPQWQKSNTDTPKTLTYPKSVFQVPANAQE